MQLITLNSYQELKFLERLVRPLLIHLGEEGVDEVSAVAIEVLFVVGLVLVDYFPEKTLDR